MSDLQQAERTQYELICKERFAELREGQNNNNDLISQVRERVFNGLSERTEQTQKDVHALRKLFTWFLVVGGLGVASLIAQLVFS